MKLRVEVKTTKGEYMRGGTCNTPAEAVALVGALLASFAPGISTGVFVLTIKQNV